MAVQIEDMDHAVPYRLALKDLFDGLGRDQRGLSAVLALIRTNDVVCGAGFYK